MEQKSEIVKAARLANETAILMPRSATARRGNSPTRDAPCDRNVSPPFGQLIRFGVADSAEQIPATKARVRTIALEALRTITPQARASASAAACTRLLALPAFAAAPAIMLYAPDVLEIDVRPIAEAAWRQGKRVGMPRVDWARRAMVAALIEDWERDLVPGPRGFPDPIPTAPVIPEGELALIVVPGVAFDPHGGRVGRGAGFYDRFLASPHVRGARIGVAFDEQIVQGVPMESWDVRLDAVVTPTRVYAPGRP